MKHSKTRYGYIEHREVFIDGGDYLILTNFAEIRILSQVSVHGSVLTWNAKDESPVKENIKRKLRDAWKEAPRMRESAHHRYCWEGVDDE